MAIVKQIGAEITQPIDDKAPNTTELTKIQPQYGIACLNFAVDKYRQLFSQLTVYLFWRPLNVGLLLVVNGMMVRYKMGEDGTLYDLVMYDVSESIQCLLFFMALFAASLFFCKVQSYFIRDISDELESLGAEEVFGVNMNRFIVEGFPQKQVEQSLLYVHREVPIVVISWRKVEGKYKVTLIGGRKVYLTPDFCQDMLQWAVERIKDKKRVVIQIECYSFDTVLKPVVRGWTKVEGESVGGLVGKVYGLERLVYEKDF